MFTRDKNNSLENLDVGLKHEIKKWLDCYTIKNYLISDDYKVIIFDNLNISEIKDVPNFIKKIIVDGNVNITDEADKKLIKEYKISYTGSVINLYEWFKNYQKLVKNSIYGNGKTYFNPIFTNSYSII